MTKLEVFDPPMCCSTGVCGPEVDPVLVRFAADLHWLANQGVHVERHNLAQRPQAFAGNDTVKAALAQEGNQCLPLVLVNDAIACRGRYPSREQLARMAGLEVQPRAGGIHQAAALPVVQSRCCAPRTAGEE
jgi:hypothetical protein